MYYLCVIYVLLMYYYKTGVKGDLNGNKTGSEGFAEVKT